MTDEGESLGDVLARRMAEAAPPADPEPFNLRSKRHDADEMVTDLAKAWGMPADDVLKDFHGNGSLARLLRRIMRVEDEEDGLSIQDYWLVEALREQGLKGAALFEKAAETANALRVKRNKPLDEQSVEKSHKRGMGILKERQRFWISVLPGPVASLPHEKRQLQKSRSKKGDK